MMKKYLPTILWLLSLFFCFGILAVSIRGISGIPNAKQLNSTQWKQDGPFELSPERGRFALLYSTVEDKSIYFSSEIGEFADPDVGVYEGKYVSLFAPLLSYIAIPGYLIGKLFNASQVGAFSTVSLFAFINMILIYKIAHKLGASKIASYISALIFLFATPSYAYAVNLYQHHVSTFLILISIYCLIKSRGATALGLVFFACATALPLDYPNLFFMFPLGLYALGEIIKVNIDNSMLSMKVNIPKIITLTAMILPICFFLWFNNSSYGSPFRLSGTVQSSKNIKQSQNLELLTATKLIKKESQSSKKSALGFFQSRNILNGFYILFLSPDRGIISFTPIILFGVLGIVISLHKKIKLYPVLVATIGANVLLYSMWGDPWGGWAFGARYLIPSYAILSIFIALLLTHWKNKIWPFIIFIPILLYSVAINTLGAITTSAIPPKVEVLELEKISGVVQRYNYLRNWEFLLSGHSKSFVYQTYLSKHITTLQFYEMITLSLFMIFGILFILFFHTSNTDSV